MPSVSSIDHVVLTVADPEATCQFYCDVLGMERSEFTSADGDQRIALSFGLQKLNLHVAGKEAKPRAKAATAGSTDICFLTANSLLSWQDHLDRFGIKVLKGPVARTGATGPITSIYLRDPDGNLVEIATRG